jgi:uncharacterized protein (DUF736 family)
MPVIGIFAPTGDGGWSGYIRTLTIDVHAKFLPNDNRENEQAPIFRLFAGRAELGAAWRQQTHGDQPRDYLSVKLDDPALPDTISAALFETADGQQAQLVWTRRLSLKS